MSKELKLDAVRKDTYSKLTHRLIADKAARIECIYGEVENDVGQRVGGIVATCTYRGKTVRGHGQTLLAALDMLAILVYYGVDPK
jgi:hypothetical protein